MLINCHFILARVFLLPPKSEAGRAFLPANAEVLPLAVVSCARISECGNFPARNSQIRESSWGSLRFTLLRPLRRGFRRRFLVTKLICSFMQTKMCCMKGKLLNNEMLYLRPVVYISNLEWGWSRQRMRRLQKNSTAVTRKVRSSSNPRACHDHEDFLILPDSGFCSVGPRHLQASPLNHLRAENFRIDFSPIKVRTQKLSFLKMFFQLSFVLLAPYAHKYLSHLLGSFSPIVHSQPSLPPRTVVNENELLVAFIEKKSCGKCPTNDFFRF